MKIGLVVKECKNNNIAFNVSQMVKAIKEAKDYDLDYIFLGESFLQGFDSLSWKYDQDKDIAVELSSKIIKEIKDEVINHQVGLGFGYFEKDGNGLYSSYLVLDKDGNKVVNYKRVSKGWKHFRHTNEMYKEGYIITEFMLENKRFTLALCGDLWDNDTKSMFKTDKVKNSILLWPVHVSYSLKEWDDEINAYHKRANVYSTKVLFINNILKPNTHGGAFYIKNNEKQTLTFGSEGVLVLDL